MTVTTDTPGRRTVVDIHCHLNVAAAEAMLPPGVRPASAGLGFSSPETDAANVAAFACIAEKLNDLAARLPDMDRLGVDIQAVSPSPGQYYYDAAPEAGRELARIVNDALTEAVSQIPDRFVGMGTVPLQSPEFAVAEMKRLRSEHGFRAVEIGGNVAGRELSDPEFAPFFAAAEETDTLLFLHPYGFTQGQRLSDHYLNNLIGNPLDTTVAVAHLIFGGVMERHPGLKICLAHGGGYLPAYWGRFDHAYRHRPDCRQCISQPPSTYLRRFHLDTLVHDRMQLDHLIESHGADRLCLGTDYPFDMGEPDPVAFHDHLPEEVRLKIVGANARRLLGLD